MAALMPQGKQQYFTAGGIPLVGGKVYTYAAGTTTPLATYTTAAASTPNTNPVILDSRGEASIFFSAANYKIVVKDSLDSTIWTQDNLPGDQAATILANLAASTGSSLVGHIASGTGAVATTVQTKLRESVSVKDFGAVGDGTTDDTTAIQTALTAAAGKRVFFPSGTYKVLSTLTVPANTVLDGYGATLTCTTSQFNPLLFANGGGVLGLTITGPASATYNANGIAIKCTGTNNSPSAPTFVNAPFVRDCTISNFGIYGVFFSYTNGGSIENNKITGIGYAGIGGGSCNDLEIYGNTISTIGPGPGTGDAYGVFVDRSNGTSETADPRSYRVVIGYNIIKSVVASGGVTGQGIDTHAGVQFSIIGNHILDCQAGIWVTNSVISGTQTLAPKNITVVGNTIKSSLRVNYGILVAGALNGATPVEYAENIIISDNTIEGHGAAATATSGAIQVQCSRGTVISNNNILRPACNGIYLNLENRAFNISGNVITDPYDNSYASPNCILVNGNNNTGLIGPNTFQFVDAALGTYVAVGSIRTNSGLTGLDLEFGRQTHIGLTASILQYLPITTTGVNNTGIAEQCGSGVLAGGVQTLVFNKRFPASPLVLVTNVSDLNPIRVAAVSATGCTFAGTGTTTFTWRATL